MDRTHLHEIGPVPRSFYQRLWDAVLRQNDRKMIDPHVVTFRGKNWSDIMAGVAPLQVSIAMYATEVRQDFEDRDPWYFLWQSAEANWFLMEQGCDPDSISYVEIEVGAIHVKHIWLGRKRS